MGDTNPMISIHDVGAGGLCNAFPELVHDSGLGAIFQLDAIPRADDTLSPLELWCNESQERYVVALDSKSVELFSRIAERERCPFAVVGVATEEERLVLVGKDGNPIDLDMSMLFGKPPKMHRVVESSKRVLKQFEVPGESIKEIADRLMRLPCIASKSFLITIGDRSVTGVVTRDQMVGPWQVPVCHVLYLIYRLLMSRSSPLHLWNPLGKVWLWENDPYPHLLTLPRVREWRWAKH
jgi:phosphoribosylformylglycinamidine synthase